MKIAIVGCGALGGYYGAKLCRDGHEVHFLLRSDHDVVKRRGVKILSPEGNFHVQPKVARAPGDVSAGAAHGTGVWDCTAARGATTGDGEGAGD